MVLLHGRPGVGKYTVGRSLAAQTGYRLVHNHAVVDLATTLFPFGSDGFIALRERLWLEVVDAALAAELAGVILTFVPESTVREAFLPALRRRVEERGGRLRLVELRCDPAVLEERIAQPDRSAFGKIRDAEFYRQLERNGAFARPSMPPPEIAVDNGALAPDAAAAHIALHLRTP